jgi:hypothetical protein
MSALWLLLLVPLAVWGMFLALATRPVKDHPCPRCGGYGWVDAFGVSLDCLSCGGTGRARGSGRG